MHPGQKIGLVEANGTGKSSLFAALLGGLDVDAGDISIPADWTVAHMAQQIDDLERPAIDFVLDGDKRFRAAEAEVIAADASGDGERIAHAHQAQYEKQQNKIAHMQSFVDRFRYKASKAKQAQARLKALERMDQIAPAAGNRKVERQRKAAARVRIKPLTNRIQKLSDNHGHEEH